VLTIIFCQGVITIGLGGVQNFGSVTAVRFLLGVFEAGLFPGLVCKSSNGTLISLCAV